MSKPNKSLQKALQRIKVTNRGPKLKAPFDLLHDWCLSRLGIEDYLEFLKKYNGGNPDPCHFRFIDAGSEAEDAVDTFHSFDPKTSHKSISLDLIAFHLRYCDLLPKNSRIIAILRSEGYLLIYLHGERKGQIWRLSNPEHIREDDDIENFLSFVAKSFTKFLELLFTPEPTSIDYLFALDNTTVTLKHLQRKMAALGCKSRKSFTKYVQEWQWPKYLLSTDDDDLPACINFGTNGKPGFAIPTPKRPPGHKMLRLSVINDATAKESLKEFQKAMGESVTYLEKADT